MPLSAFHPAVAQWFEREFPAPTEPQVAAWPAIQSGEHALIAAPTGSGKTLAAFLAAIDSLVRQGIAGRLTNATQVVYVSPLKALSNDVQRNLERPLAGINEELAKLGLPDLEIRAQVRTGDTPQSERTAMRKNPPHILVTTPESLYLLVTSDSGREMLSTSRTVIVDEIHAVAATKRGAHLSLTLERLAALCSKPLQRIGLSATQKPIEEVASFLVGNASPHPNLPHRTCKWSGVQEALELPPPLSQGRESDANLGFLSPPPVAGGGLWWGRPPACRIIDSGHIRQRDLALVLPDAPLEAVMSGEVWNNIYDKLAAIVATHR